MPISTFLPVSVSYILYATGIWRFRWNARFRECYRM